jgi:hypothetical protein
MAVQAAGRCLDGSGAGVRPAACTGGRGQTDIGGAVRAEVSQRPCCAACRLKGLCESFRSHGAGAACLRSFRTRNGAEWKRRPVVRFTGRRWNGAEWSVLKRRSQAPKAAGVSRETGLGDSPAVLGSRGCVLTACWRPRFPSWPEARRARFVVFWGAAAASFEIERSELKFYGKGDSPAA